MMCAVLRAHGVTDKGRVRATNEDYFVIDERLRLCVVADGMGGHNAGEVAARMAVDAIVEFVRARVQRGDAQPTLSVDETWPFGLDPALSESGNLLRTAVHLANVQILEAAGTGEAYAGASSAHFHFWSPVASSNAITAPLPCPPRCATANPSTMIGDIAV